MNKRKKIEQKAAEKEEEDEERSRDFLDIVDDKGFITIE